MKIPTRPKTALQTRSDALELLIRIAALSIHPRAGIDALAAKAGVTGEAIRYSIRHGRFTAKMARRIEAAVGKGVLPKEKLCPHK